MKHLKKYVISSVVRTAHLSRDCFYIFKEDNTLEKRSLNGKLLWSKDANYRFAMLEGNSEIILYEFGKLYLIDRGSGSTGKEVNLPFLPISIFDKFIYGEVELKTEKYIAKYNIVEDKLSTLFSLEEGRYCRFIYQSYALIGENVTNKKIELRSLDRGEIMWNYEMMEEDISIRALFFKDTLIIRMGRGYTAFKLKTGELIWQIPYSISAFDDQKGLVYVLSSDYLVIDVTTGEEVIKVENWLENQIEQYPALIHMQGTPYISEEYLVFTGCTRGEKIEGGVFFVDKTTANVKEYLRIVFDKDPFQRKDWYGNEIPNDQQIPFIPLDNPIYRDDRLYVTLSSPIDWHKDLYVFEKEI